MVKIVIDMMGGDNGYAITIEAVQKFLKEHDDCEIIAVGDEKVLNCFDSNGITIISAHHINYYFDHN